MKFLRNLILPFVFAGALSLTTSANAACKVHLGDFDWDSANVHTAIASFILEKGYGCEVRVTREVLLQSWQLFSINKLIL